MEVLFTFYVNIFTSPLDRGPEQAVHLLYGTVEHARERLSFPPGSTDSESSRFSGIVPESNW
jgi:hypothetical protein